MAVGSATASVRCSRLRDVSRPSQRMIRERHQTLGEGSLRFRLHCLDMIPHSCGRRSSRARELLDSGAAFERMQRRSSTRSALRYYQITIFRIMTADMKASNNDTVSGIEFTSLRMGSFRRAPLDEGAGIKIFEKIIIDQEGRCSPCSRIYAIDHSDMILRITLRSPIQLSDRTTTIVHRRETRGECVYHSEGTHPIHHDASGSRRGFALLPADRGAPVPGWGFRHDCRRRL